VKHENFDYSKQLIENKDDRTLLFYYSLVNSLRPIYKNNQIEIIEETPQLYSKSIELIRSAKKFIHLQTYILHDGF